MRQPCSLCLQGGLAAWGQKNGFSLSRCRACGAVTATIPPSAEPRPGLYDEIYAGRGPTPPPVVRESLKDLIRSAGPRRLTARWLDVGFGAGTLLEEAEAAGWTCHGTEISGVALEQGRRKGWTVADRLDASVFPVGEFDVVTLIELVEHLKDPVPHLAAALRLLRPGGLLYLTTPNGDSLNRRILGSGWSAFAPPDHRVIWTARALRAALRRLGCEHIRVRSSGLNPSDLLDRVRRQRRPERRVATAYALNTALSSSPIRRSAKRAVNGILSLTGTGDTLKVRAFRSR